MTCLDLLFDVMRNIPHNSRCSPRVFYGSSREMQTPKGFVELIFPAPAAHGKEGPFDYENRGHLELKGGSI